ncbi:MAG TPA: M23 family metallopeptidase [Clostridiales bacterium]|nr:M23 family metallopeptidase [Clostridiales bacterium]
MGSKRFRNKLKETFSRKRIIKFLDKQGFYIVLFICICIISVTTFWASRGNLGDLPKQLGLGQQSEDHQLSDEFPDELPEDIEIEVQDVITSDEGEVEQDIGGQKQEEQQAEKQQAEERQEDKRHKEAYAQPSSKVAMAAQGKTVKQEEVQQQQQLKLEPASLVMPVAGRVIKEFAMDKLIYCNTLEQWTTHPGIDIKAEQGAQVKAAADGRVAEVGEDGKLGIYILIDHGGGVRTRYANLSTKNMVSKGEEVKKNQIISGVGKTANFEISDAPHLHFELIHNDVPIDPTPYLAGLN